MKQFRLATTSSRGIAAGLAVLAVCGVLGWSNSVAAQIISEEQLIRQLTGKAAAPGDAAPTAGKPRLKRSFSAKERTDPADVVAVAVNERPQVDLEIYFDPASAAVTQRAIPSLDVLGRVLASDQFKANTFLIAGHTDGVGGSSYNLALSKRRAEAVRRYIATQFKIDGARLRAIGHGKEQLKLPTEPANPRNRRVQVVNLSAVK